MAAAGGEQYMRQVEYLRQEEYLRLMKNMIDVVYLLERPATILIIFWQGFSFNLVNCFFLVTTLVHAIISLERERIVPIESIDGLRFFIFIMERIAMAIMGLNPFFYVVAKFIFLVTNMHFWVTNLRHCLHKAAEEKIDETDEMPNLEICEELEEAEDNQEVVESDQQVNGYSEEEKEESYEPALESPEEAKEDDQEEEIVKGEREIMAGGHGHEANCCTALWSASAGMIEQLVEEATEQEADQKKEINSELNSAISSLEFFPSILQNYEEEIKRLKEQNASVSRKLDGFHDLLEEILRSSNGILKSHLECEAERTDLSKKLCSANSWYEYYFQASHKHAEKCKKLAEEKSVISGKLEAATALSEKYKACVREATGWCRKLKEENRELAAKLLTETLSGKLLRKMVADGEEKCQRLEKEKADLNVRIDGLKNSCDFYMSYVRQMAI